MPIDKRTEATPAKAQKEAEAADNAAAEGQQSQLQSTSAEPGKKAENDPTKKAKEETQFFDTTIAKVVMTEDGEEIVVMSDYLDPGEKLKREVDAEKAEKRAKEAKDAAEKAASK